VTEDCDHDSSMIQPSHYEVVPKLGGTRQQQNNQTVRNAKPIQAALLLQQSPDYGDDPARFEEIAVDFAIRNTLQAVSFTVNPTSLITMIITDHAVQRKVPSDLMDTCGNVVAAKGVHIHPCIPMIAVLATWHPRMWFCAFAGMLLPLDVSDKGWKHVTLVGKTRHGQERGGGKPYQVIWWSEGRLLVMCTGVDWWWNLEVRG